MASLFIIMGVSGSGKTTIAQELSIKTGIPYYDADDYHSPANKEKMKNGIPLNDDDRQGWLESLNQLMKERAETTGAILACSALKEKYRRLLAEGISTPLYWVVLKGDYELIKARMEARKDHYMPPGLLISQIETMQYPPYGLHLSIDHPPKDMADYILKNYSLQEFGLAGLGVMGKSLARNLASKGIRLSLYNQYVAGKEEGVASALISQYESFKDSLGFEDVPSFVQSLSLPRKIFLMVPAGKAIDDLIDKLKAHLQAGDILIDGGNSLYTDTERRQKDLNADGIHFIGCGVSGGESGALTGPAIMPGGTKKAYDQISEILESIAAKDTNAGACCTYIGPGGSGHFVKMIHNGIEYAEMQLVAEVYWLLKKGKGYDNETIAKVFEVWSQKGLSSYLLDISIKILRFQNKQGYVLDQIADISGTKGTGGWSVSAAASLGVPATMVAEALFNRFISSVKNKRIQNQIKWNISTNTFELETEVIREAFLLARWINHHQGFEIMEQASTAYDWNLNLNELARTWTNGCIIRSAMMEEIHLRYHKGQGLLTILEQEASSLLPSLKKTVTSSSANNLPMSCFSSALQFVLSFGSADLPANMIQAQRDFFGAHTYKLKNDPHGPSYHTQWE